ncbi:MAG: hypothetical protein ACK53V_01235 [Planctomycetota bacterium]
MPVRPMKNIRFSRRMAPLVGVAVGSLCGLQAGLLAQIPLAWFGISGAALGGLAGALIMLLEPRSSESENGDFSRQNSRPSLTHSSGVVGRFLAVVGCGLCWFPILGLILNLAGLLANQQAGDWAKRVSLMSLVISAGLSTLFVILFALGVIS